MHSVESARARMQGFVQALGSEPVALHIAAGRTLAEATVAARGQPPFRSSAMDGYAVRSADMGLGRFAVVGQSAAGAAHQGGVGHGEAVRIFTGAPVPQGADWVIPQEKTRREGNVVYIDALANPPQNIREAGIDFAAGVSLIETGTRLHARHVALLASAGIASIGVRVAPRIALLATGTEIATPGTPVGPYQIFDSVTYGLGAMLESWGGRMASRTACPDDDAEVAAAIDAAVRLADLVVIVGGASVGDYDVVKRALSSRGLEIMVPKVAVRPGQPTWFGAIADKPILGLPGNPAAAFVCAYLFLRPLIDTFLARANSSGCVPAVLEGKVQRSGDFERYWRSVIRVGEDGRLLVRPFDNQDSSLVSVFASSNALIRRLPGQGPCEPGAIVEVVLLNDCGML